MSVLLKHFFSKSKGLLRLNHLLKPTVATMSSMANSLNCLSTKGDSSTEKNDYEGAVLKLQTLISNADALAAARTSRELRRSNYIANMNKFILQSGLKEEDIAKLSVIHVSGTKGKGSTCAFCERILYSKGYKTGLFSSPHLVEVRERIRINGRPVSKELYAHHFWKVYNRLRAMQVDKDEKLPAYFAFNTILCLHIFLAEGVDVSILEVGIGGEYDSTNFIRKPAVCGVTSLGFDHMSVLGHTIEEIAWNKAGIFKTGCPAIVVSQQPSAMQVILNRAKERQSALYITQPIDEDVLVKANIQLGISGCKQRDNAGLAVQLAQMWEERHRNDPMEPVVCNLSHVDSTDEIPVLLTEQVDNATATGLSSCVWPGRAQTVKRPGVTYFLDGAHTRESIQVCSQWFKEAADKEASSIQGKVVRVLIFNVTGERKPEPLLDCLKDCGFDAAGFSTNTVSTVESFNKKDQVNPHHTSKTLMEKTEGNRLCWEKIIQSLKQQTSPSTNMDFFTSDQDSSVVEGPKKRVVDKSSVPGHINPVPLAVPSNVKSSNANEKVMETFSQGFLSSTSSNSPVDNNDATQPVKKDNYNNNNNSISNNYNNKCLDSSARQNVFTYDNPCVVYHENNWVEGNTSLDKDAVHLSILHSSSLSSSSSSSSSTSTSHSFPCLLQALTWATQSRDLAIAMKDPTAHLPPVPSALANSDHIQVLVTGSLLLVGGVLGVITPNMYD